WKQPEEYTRERRHHDVAICERKGLTKSAAIGQENQREVPLRNLDVQRGVLRPLAVVPDYGDTINPLNEPSKPVRQLERRTGRSGVGPCQRLRVGADEQVRINRGIVSGEVADAREQAGRSV